jgi:hypothetical protein
MKLWCARHNGGWCALYVQSKQYQDNLHTLCHHVIVLALDIQRREPTCPACLHPPALKHGPATWYYDEVGFKDGKWHHTISPRPVRILALAESYAMIRGKGAMPTTVSVRELSQP